MLKMIAAVSKNHQIGLNKQMPWHLPEDLQYFKKVTFGNPIIMGRKTYESIGRPLPNRRNIVLTRDPSFCPQDIDIVTSINEALQLSQQYDDFFVIGGGEIYRAFLPYADQLYLTLIDQRIDGDTSFPDYTADFECIWHSPSHLSSSGDLSFTFTIWQRKEKSHL